MNLNYVTETGGCDLLATAVVTQAVEDYQKALMESWALEKKLVKLEETIKECEDFFKSEWFRDLMDIDGSTVRRNARQIAREDFANAKSVSVTIKIKPKEEPRDSKEEA